MRIAIVGCGQLARMLALAGIPMGLRFSFLATESQEDTVCVQDLGLIVRYTPGDSAAELYRALGSPDIVTAEKEQLDVSLLVDLQNFCKVFPSPQAFSAGQHRYREKQLLDSLGVRCSDYVYRQSAQSAIEKLGLPFVAKSCELGYDGKGQSVIKSQLDAEQFDSQVVSDDTNANDFILERWIPFDREVSQISVRSREGEILHYPLTENLHRSAILHQSIAPAPDVTEQMVECARHYITQIMETLDYIGVIAMECFVVGQDLLVNEIAPRVHNSGHWTQLGSHTSQFENHIRAIIGAPLGSTSCVGVAGMLNLIGVNPPAFSSVSQFSQLHWYDKQVRPGRKLGHVNFIGDSIDEVNRQMSEYSTLHLSGEPS